MKKLIIIKIIASTLLFTGCGKVQVSDQMLTTIIATGTSLTFKYALASDVENRKMIAKYVSGIAGSARALSGNESPQEVAQALIANIPPDVLAKYPEIGTIVVPQVVTYFQSGKEKLGAGTKEFAAHMNAVAAGLEQGVAYYL